MASTIVKVGSAILAIIGGAGLAIFWQDLRPDDEFMTVVGVGVVAAVCIFTSLFYLTKGSGGD
ncbi:MAG: hypothetical protein WCT31_03090 [Candidatus Micrarchaeia archaeon]|jgi:hypothetical protein